MKKRIGWVDIAHRMDIDVNSSSNSNNVNETKYTYDVFAVKLRKIENTLSNEFIRSVFNSLKRNVNDTFVYAYALIDAFDVFKHEHLRNIKDGNNNTNNKYIPSFKHHYITTTIKQTNHNI